MSKKYLEFNRKVGIDFTTELADVLHEKMKTIGIKSDPEALFCNLYDEKYSEKLDDLIQCIIEDLT